MGNRRNRERREGVRNRREEGKTKVRYGGRIEGETREMSFVDAGTGHFQMEASSVGEACTSHLMEIPSLGVMEGDTRRAYLP